MEATDDLQQKSPEELQKIILQMRSELAQTKQELASKHQVIEKLRHQLNNALRQRYGRKSEKNPDQLSLFDEIKTPDNIEEIEEAEEEISVAGHKRKKAGRKGLSKDLPRIQCIHDLSDEEKICGCGHQMVKIGEEISEQLDIIPAKTQVIQHIKLKYACKPCQGNVKQAKAPKHPIPQSVASPGLLAHIAVSKFCDHLPLYRQESILQRMGVEIARNTLSLWMIRIAELFRPLYKLLHDNLVTYDIAYADETRTQVLKEDGRPAEAQSYMWCFIGGPPDKRSIIYHYNQSRAHTVILDMLDGFSGALHCDGYGGYDTYARVTENIKLIACWMHCRRKFYEVAKSSKKKGLADKSVKKIAKLYRIEKEMKEQHLTADDVYQYRQEHAKPLLEEFKLWLDENSKKAPPQSPLGQAFTYALNQWDKLIRYVDDGRLEMDNGLSERQIKPFVIGRKNWLFYNSVAGVKAAEVIYSIIESAKANNLEPYTYLRSLLTHLPNITTEKELEALLPYNITPNKMLIAS